MCDKESAVGGGEGEKVTVTWIGGAGWRRRGGIVNQDRVVFQELHELMGFRGGHDLADLWIVERPL